MSDKPLQEFARDWSNLSKRRTAPMKVVEHFNENLATESFKHVMSVGPGDCRIENGLLASSLKNIHNLYVVEPDTKFDVESRIKFDLSKVEHFKGKIEVYEHNGPKLDLILLSHCLYYFYSQRIEVLTKLKSWLAKDGMIVIIVNSTPIIYQIDDMIPGLNKKTAIKPLELDALLQSVGLDYHYSHVKFTWDVSGYAQLAGEWVGFLTNKQLNDNEVEIAKRLIQEHCEEDVIQCTELIAVCHPFNKL